jgi:anti-sigma regulatory factor (Ser/Thr protein kinase)
MSGGAGGTGIASASASAFGPGASGAAVPLPPSAHRAGIAGEWPLQDTLELGSLPGAVPCARLHTRHVLWEWGLTGISEDAELLITELMTNAITASHSVKQILPVRMWLLSDRARVLVLVWDASTRPPVPADTSEDAETGRGLQLVEAISQRWNWYFPQEAGGKVVWAIAD